MTLQCLCSMYLQNEMCNNRPHNEVQKYTNLEAQ